MPNYKTNKSKSATTKTRPKLTTKTKPKHTAKHTAKLTPKTYERLKRFVIRAERDNYDSIYLTPCTGKSSWHEIGDHSALFYYYDVLKNRVKKPKFNYDTFSGYYNHYEFGRISVKNIDDVIHALKTANIPINSITHLDATGRPTNSKIHITRIKLGTIYTDTEIFDLITKEKARRTQVLRVPHANEALPDLYLDISNFATTIHHLCNRNFDKFARAGIAKTMLAQSDSIFRTYLEANTIFSIVGEAEHTNPAIYFHGIHKIIQKYQYINSTISDLIISLQMVYSYQYIGAEHCCVAHSQLLSIKERLVKTTKYLQQKEQNHVTKNQD